MKILPNVEVLVAGNGHDVSVHITVPARVALVIAGFLPGLCREITGDIPNAVNEFCTRLREEGLR